MDAVKKLAKISEVMGDGYNFLKIMTWVKDWEELAKQGDTQAEEMMNITETMHRLCLVAEQRK